MGVKKDIDWINTRLTKNKVSLNIAIMPCDDIDKDRGKGKADKFCHVGHKPALICCNSHFHKLRSPRRKGLLAHEIGHISLLNKGLMEHTEHEADAEAMKLLGVNIKYDKDGIQFC